MEECIDDFLFLDLNDNEERSNQSTMTNTVVAENDHDIDVLTTTVPVTTPVPYMPGVTTTSPLRHDAARGWGTYQGYRQFQGLADMSLTQFANYLSRKNNRVSMERVMKLRTVNTFARMLTTREMIPVTKDLDLKTSASDCLQMTTCRAQHYNLLTASLVRKRLDILRTTAVANKGHASGRARGGNRRAIGHGCRARAGAKLAFQILGTLITRSKCSVGGCIYGTNRVGGKVRTRAATSFRATTRCAETSHQKLLACGLAVFGAEISQAKVGRAEILLVGANGSYESRGEGITLNSRRRRCNV